MDSLHNLVGGFNPFEKYQSKWESSPNRGENKKYLKPPASSPFRGKEFMKKMLPCFREKKKLAQ